MALLRRELGAALRHRRTAQRRSLRNVAADAGVSLGYLSEVERGVKEASSELLTAICRSLAVPLPELLVEVAGRLRSAEAGPASLAGPLSAAAGPASLAGPLPAAAPVPAVPVPPAAAAVHLATVPAEATRAAA